jgi:hypothetical protein
MKAQARWLIIIVLLALGVERVLSNAYLEEIAQSVSVAMLRTRQAHEKPAAAATVDTLAAPKKVAAVEKGGRDDSPEAPWADGYAAEAEAPPQPVLVPVPVLTPPLQPVATPPRPAILPDFSKQQGHEEREHHHLKFNKCRDSGEAYAAAYFITAEHLFNQFTDYNLTWVNCEMGSFIMMNQRAHPQRDANGSYTQSLDVLDYSVGTSLPCPALPCPLDLT